MHSQTVHSHIETLCSRGNSNPEVLRLSLLTFFSEGGYASHRYRYFQNDDAPRTDKTLLIAKLSKTRGWGIPLTLFRFTRAYQPIADKHFRLPNETLSVEWLNRFKIESAQVAKVHT